MGTMASVRAFYGLLGVGTPSKTNVANSLALGVSDQSTSITGADVFYSFTVTSAAAANVATLDLATSTVAQTTGTPTITDGDGNDFEGADIPTVDTVYAILMERTVTPVDSITVAAQDTSLSDRVIDESTTGYFLEIFPSGIAFGANTDITFTFADAADSITVTVAAGAA